MKVPTRCSYGASPESHSAEMSPVSRHCQALCGHSRADTELLFLTIVHSLPPR